MTDELKKAIEKEFANAETSVSLIRLYAEIQEECRKQIKSINLPTKSHLDML